MIIDSLKMTLSGKTHILPGSDSISPLPYFKHTGDKVLINLWSHRLDVVPPKNQKDTSLITIYYHGIPADGLIISKTKYGHRSFFADNWPNRGHNWIPCHDDPADKATVEFIVTAPEHSRLLLMVCRSKRLLLAMVLN
jgi:hypothetical protein